MDLYIYHGRLDPKGPATDLEGNEVDDWGFEGPRLQGVLGFHCTYDLFNVFFDSIENADNAQVLTGWEKWDEKVLTLEMTDNCVRIYNVKRGRFEYFGDWGMK
jgi:hypothetical protein